MYAAQLGEFGRALCISENVECTMKGKLLPVPGLVVWVCGFHLFAFRFSYAKVIERRLYSVRS